MVQLRSCYFCGTTEALAEYETLPERLHSESADGRTVVLCDRCQRKLRTVLDPLVERLDAAGSVDADHRSEDGPVAAAADGAVTDETGAVDGVERQPDDGGPSRDDSDPRTEGSDARAEDSGVRALHTARQDTDQTDVTFDTGRAETESDGDESAGTQSADTADTTDTETADTGADDAEADAGGRDETASGGETTATRSLAAPDETVESEQDGDGADGERTAGTDAADGEDSADGDDTADEQSTTDTDGPASVSPMTYYKLLRFLRNRELPMPRGRAEALVSGAYDLSEREASDLIDLAIERDALVEADGRIDRT